MKKRKLIHPRKMKWAMEEFCNEVSTLTYTVVSVPSRGEMDFDEYWKKILAKEDQWQEEEMPVEIKVVKDNKSCAYTYDHQNVDDSVAKIGFNLEGEWSRESRQFAQDFYSRCPMGRGFATVTLTLLHELGHFHAEQEFDGYDRFEELKRIRKNFPCIQRNFEYFKLPDEAAATNWAIEWLSYPENRKLAKRFEKKFFACFAK